MALVSFICDSDLEDVARSDETDPMISKEERAEIVRILLAPRVRVSVKFVVPEAEDRHGGGCGEVGGGCGADMHDFRGGVNLLWYCTEE